MKKFAITAVALATWTLASAGSYLLVVPVAGEPELRITGDLSFGTILAGESVSKDLVLHNSGSRPVDVQFRHPESLTLTGTCAAGVAPASQCVATLTWAPTDRETLSGALIVQPARQRQLARPATGTSILAPRLDTVGSVDFGRVLVNTTSTSTLTINNTGDLPANVTITAPEGITVSGDCSSISAQGSCTLSLSWTPTTGAAMARKLTVATGGTQTEINLSGDGYIPLSITGGSTQVTGSRYTTDGGVSRTWTIQNHGSDTAEMSYSELATSMTRGGTCGATLAGSSTCTVTLTWSPSTTRTLDHTVVVSASNGSQQSQTSVRMIGSATYAFGYYPTLGNATNWDLAANARAAGWNGASPLMSSITVNSGAKIGSSSVSAYAMTISSGLPAGSRTTLFNNGQILGQGGAGGSAHMPGSRGGPALYLGSAATIYNYGTIAGGGGGGGGSVSQGSENVSAGGAGGGGGQGYSGSAGGTGYSTEGLYPRGGNGGSGSQAGPGSGGAGAASGYFPNQHSAPYHAYSRAGGHGGSWGSAGTSSDYAGGAAGAAVSGVAATWGYTGTVYGSR